MNKLFLIPIIGSSYCMLTNLIGLIIPELDDNPKNLKYARLQAVLGWLTALTVIIAYATDI